MSFAFNLLCKVFKKYPNESFSSESYIYNADDWEYQAFPFLSFMWFIKYFACLERVCCVGCALRICVVMWLFKYVLVYVCMCTCVVSSTFVYRLQLPVLLCMMLQSYLLVSLTLLLILQLLNLLFAFMCSRIYAGMHLCIEHI